MSAIEQPALRSGRIATWSRLGQDVGDFRHEVHAAEHDVLGVGLRGELGELQRIAGQVGVLVDVGPLVVVAEDHRAPAELRPRGEYALLARVVGERLERSKAIVAASMAAPGIRRPCAAEFLMEIVNIHHACMTENAATSSQSPHTGRGYSPHCVHCAAATP